MPRVAVGRESTLLGAGCRERSPGVRGILHPSEKGGTGRGQARLWWSGSRSSRGSACRQAQLAMGEVEISARAYGKMCLHASRYPHAAVNGLLLAPATRSGECLCLTDCVPLFHSHLALSVMLEVALNQVAASRTPPLVPLHPVNSFRTLCLNACAAGWPWCALAEPEA